MINRDKMRFDFLLPHLLVFWTPEKISRNKKERREKIYYVINYFLNMCVNLNINYLNILCVDFTIFYEIDYITKIMFNYLKNISHVNLWSLRSSNFVYKNQDLTIGCKHLLYTIIQFIQVCYITYNNFPSIILDNLT